MTKINNLAVLLSVAFITMLCIGVFISKIDKMNSQIEAVNNQVDSGFIQVRAIKLYSDYLADKELADEEYLSNVLEIKGTLSDWEQDSGNYITLVSDYNGNDSIVCYFSQELIEPKLNILKGKEVNVTGTCAGINNDTVTILNCESTDGISELVLLEE